MQRNTATRTEAAALKQTGRRWRVNQAAELVGDPPNPPSPSRLCGAEPRQT